MREIICVLYVMLYTWITALARYKNGRATDPKGIKEGQAKNYKMLQQLSRGILKIVGADLHIEGQENLLNQGTCVYMGSHKSSLDIPIMIMLINEPVVFIGKAELMKVPFIGTWIAAVGGLPMERENIRQSLQVILEAIGELESGYSVGIFPEGTRAKGREMGDFKAGSFKLATKANVPIIPIAMQDTFKLFEEKGRIRPAKIHVKIGEAIDIPNLTKEKKQSIVKDTESYMKELLDQATASQN